MNMQRITLHICPIFFFHSFIFNTVTSFLEYDFQKQVDLGFLSSNVITSIFLNLLIYLNLFLPLSFKFFQLINSTQGRNN